MEKIIVDGKEMAVQDAGKTSDGYHTFDELYHHRGVLFSLVVRACSRLAWKSKLHADGTMFPGMFVVGIDTPQGQATYHYDVAPYWDMMCCEELERAPEWDGHTPAEAIERISNLQWIISQEVTKFYTHTLQCWTNDPARVINRIEETSWSLATSDLPGLIWAAEDGAEGYQEHDYEWSNVPTGYINQLSPESPGKYWRLEYTTCSGINHVVIHKRRGGNGLDEYSVVWEVQSNNPPHSSSAVKDAVAKGWQHNYSMVELGERIARPGQPYIREL